MPSVKKPAAKTYHEGAHDERTAIMAKVRRELKTLEYNFGLGSDAYEAVHAIQQFLLGRHRRYSKKAGAL